MSMTFPGKITLRIQPVFWILVFFIAFINSNSTLAGMVIWVTVIVISVVVHEFGHALTAVAFGQRAHIDLVAFGGLTHRHGPHINLWQEFLIVLNGPLAGLALAFVCYFLGNMVGGKSPLLYLFFEVGYVANIFWTVLNLLPMQPLDGGHLLRIIFEGLFGLRGLKISLFISLIASLAFCMLLLMSTNYILGIFFMMFAYENYRAWKNSLQLTESDKDKTLLHLVKNAEKDYHKGNEDIALHKLEHLLKQTHKGVIFQRSTELSAKILEKQGRNKEAYQKLLPLKSRLSPESLILLHKLAYRLGELQEAISLGTLSFQRQPTYEVALINALSYALLGEVKPTIGWLQCALKEGLPNFKDIVNEMEFNNVRSDPQFQDFVKSKEQ